jgi:hypothetical protein
MYNDEGYIRLKIDLVHKVLIKSAVEREKGI